MKKCRLKILRDTKQYIYIYIYINMENSINMKIMFQVHTNNIIFLVCM